MENPPPQPTTSKKKLLLSGFLLVILPIAGYFFWQALLHNSLQTSRVHEPVSITPEGQACSQRRYTMKEALQNPASVCDLQITTDQEFMQLASTSGSFTGLQTVYFNKVNATVSAEFAKLSNLRAMNFHHTSSTVLAPEIGKMQNLTVLHMSKTDVETLPKEIGELKNLTQLVISLNTKKVILPSEIRNLPKLNVLTIRNNPGIVLPAFSAEQNIEYLDIAETQTTDIPATVYMLNRLKTLNLSDNRISSVSGEIANLSELRELRADGNLLSTFPDIGALQSLETLNLNTNKLTTLPAGIMTLKKLKYVNLSGNTISSQEIEQLKQALPNAQIVY